MPSEIKPVTLKHISEKTGEALWNILKDELDKATEDYMFNYNLDAYGNYCAKVVGIIDDLCGKIKEGKTIEQSVKTVKKKNK